jgi:hypothetical protein
MRRLRKVLELVSVLGGWSLLQKHVSTHAAHRLAQLGQDKFTVEVLDPWMLTVNTFRENPVSALAAASAACTILVPPRSRHNAGRRHRVGHRHCHGCDSASNSNAPSTALIEAKR